EVHDSVEDHRVQLTILKGLVERFPGRVSVGMEMFRRPSQDKLDAWIRGDLSDKAFLKLWYEEWGMDEKGYHELLAYIRREKIPLIALNASEKMVRAISEKGFEGLSESEKKSLPEIDQSDPYYRQALETLFKGHGAGTEGFKVFYNTMLLWDETMAESISRYLGSPEGKDRKMVVFAGGFHFAYGFGVPRRTYRRLGEPYRVVIPHSKMPAEMSEYAMMNPQIEIEAPDLPLYYANYVWAVPYKILATSHVRLGVQIEPAKEGVRIIAVIPGSVADQAGVKKGDVVIRFDGESMKEPFDLTYAVQQKKPGEKGRLSLLRENQTMEIEVTFRPSKHP
ncbi:MAG TPA: ChaN family lipoprotein, partial [Nitrospiria bacterium]|nr:ChaN family lipoprotein [Nitrospiria bacterium]